MDEGVEADKFWEGERRSSSILAHLFLHEVVQQAAVLARKGPGSSNLSAQRLQLIHRNALKEIQTNAQRQQGNLNVKETIKQNMTGGRGRSSKACAQTFRSMPNEVSSKLSTVASINDSGAMGWP